MDLILGNRNAFISKAALETHSGYAYNQIKKAKGSNKKVHNPQPEQRPVKEDYCRVILLDDLQGYIDYNKAICPINEDNGWTYRGTYPFRPYPLKGIGIDLSEYHVASLEHAPNVYRLYHYGDKAKGVFRGDDMLVTESIPKEDEWSKIVGLFLYDKNEYDKALKAWHSYWDWMKFRNSARWVDQEKGNLDYDQKNMMHCVRLLMSGENILANGEPLVRVDGERKKYLMRIRNGELTYKEIMDDVEDRMSKLKSLKSTSTIPESVDQDWIEEIYKEVLFAKFGES